MAGRVFAGREWFLAVLASPRVQTSNVWAVVRATRGRMLGMATEVGGYQNIKITYHCPHK